MTDAARFLRRDRTDSGPRPQRGDARPAAGMRASRSYGFAINGRFLSQPVTGVQRYAREIVGAMDTLLGAEARTLDLLTPRVEGPPPAWRAINIRRIGPGSGQAWEQAILPLKNRRPLLNLCNTAPAFGGQHVVCLHDANVFLEPESYGRAFRMFYQYLQPQVARKALRLTSVSRDAALKLARVLNICVGRIEILGNGHEHALRWRPERSTLLSRWQPERPFVFLLGSRARHKNVDRIVGLAEALDALNLDIVIAGGEAPIFAQAAQQRARNLHWLGRVSDDDLAALFQRALCLAFPSLTEGFGLPLVESMALGCPVVSSNRASLPEICGSAALLADPTEPSAWISHIRALAESRAMQAELRGRGFERVKRYSWTASARGYLDLFEG